MTQERKVDFGFGCMRLPVLQKDQPDSFDYEKIERLFDAFLSKGFPYFDTAYPYHGYHAEEAVRKALVERHPRKNFQLATKLPCGILRMPTIWIAFLMNSWIIAASATSTIICSTTWAPMSMKNAENMMLSALWPKRRTRGRSARWGCLSTIRRSCWTRSLPGMGACWISSSCKSTMWIGSSLTFSPADVWRSPANTASLSP